ncbi:MAG TPA: aminotransferase class III-fold pyridoxal phosphate-dependent enzyme [Candidatus Binataceae bacterium]|nr:aminotransferase class III-fold pyridoxal phosphate-dependent enzyme [Candidatus Binataceae bacterium]
MNSIEQRYRARTSASAAIGARAARVMPGGDTRSVTYHRPYPLTLARGAGPHLWDLDGNRYIDLLGNYTSLVHGNAYPPIVEAIARASAQGTAWPARNLAQIELAELICERVASVERVRLCNSGSEAGMLAAQLSRRVTARGRLLMARQGYHGSYDDLEAEWAGEGGRTLLAEYGDASSFEAALARHGDQIAAVFLEPVLGSSGIITPPPDFLPRVAGAARRAGALFVIDEVITLRLGIGGAQAAAGVAPDLTMMGKIVGGGLPVGALGGRADLMAHFDPAGPHAMHHSGTFNGNPLTCAAGVVSLRELSAGRIAAMDRMAARMQAELERAAAALGLPFGIRRAGSLMNVTFDSSGPGDVHTPAARMMENFHLAALNAGLFFAPRGLIALSTVMTAELIAEICERAAAALGEVARETNLMD